MNNLRKIGLDPGFSSLKVAEVNGKGVTTYLLPSVVGLAAATNSGLHLGGIGLRRRGPKPFEVRFEGYEYLVGPNVASYTEPLHRMDFDRFTDSPELRASLYAALYQVVNGGGHRVALAAALPVGVLQDKSEANRVERAMQGWLIGHHVFSVNGVETHLNITALRAKIPQPVASWMEWGLDESGQWVKGAEALKSPTLVIDEGFNTLDVLVVQNGHISDRLSGGDTLGTRRAAERLADALHRRFRLKLDLLEANDLIWRATKGQKAIVYLYGEKEDVTAQARQAIRSLETDVVQFLEGVLKQRRAYRVILTGGGSLSLTTRLLQLFPNATVLHEPVLANARGLAKMANRTGFLA